MRSLSRRDRAIARRVLDDGAKYREAAAEFNISISRVHQILRNYYSWKYERSPAALRCLTRQRRRQLWEAHEHEHRAAFLERWRRSQHD